MLLRFSRSLYVGIMTTTERFVLLPRRRSSSGLSLMFVPLQASGQALMRRGVSIYVTFSRNVQYPSTGVDRRWRPPPSHQCLSRLVGTGPHSSCPARADARADRTGLPGLAPFPGIDT